MKKQDGKTPLEWIITIVVSIIIIGAAIAMLVGNTEEIINIVKEKINRDTNTNDIVQTQTK